ncbi:MAG: Holliday junction branch migration protein RuvA [Acidobacteriota bacterium]|nr:Holliday junction branch migration protein RuvA [Acidobacteriota bacterium]
MIAHLRGKLISKHPGQAIVEAGGVGYDLVISVTTFTELPPTGGEVALHVHTHVREDALALFGFLRAEEKRLFERLISVSGVGPKLAMTILSGMPSAADIVGAIRSSDIGRMTKIPGVGKKTAERLALELKDKLDSFGAAPARAAAGSPLEEDVLSALVNLGYQRPHAERAVAAAAANGAGPDGKKSASFDALFRQALAALSK